MPFPTYDTKEKIPAGFEELYAEKDGAWAFSGPTSDDVKKLSETLDRVRADNKTEAKRAKELEEQVSALRRANDGKTAVTDDAKLAELLKGWEKDTEAKLAPEREARTKAETKLRELLVTAAAKKAALDAGVLSKYVDDVYALVGNRFDLVDGERAVVLDEQGQPTPLQLGEFFAAQKDRFAWAFGAHPASGSGADPNAGAQQPGARMGSSPYTREQWDKLSPFERMDAIAKFPDIEKKRAA